MIACERPDINFPVGRIIGLVAKLPVQALVFSCERVREANFSDLRMLGEPRRDREAVRHVWRAVGEHFKIDISVDDEVVGDCADNGDLACGAPASDEREVLHYAECVAPPSRGADQFVGHWHPTRLP